jgi:hypothetical protein
LVRSAAEAPAGDVRADGGVNEVTFSAPWDPGRRFQRTSRRG